MAVATKIQLPYLEDTGLDGKKLYTPKEWTERLRHYIKRIYNIDIKPILTDDTYQPETRGIQKSQISDKILSGVPDRQQLKSSQKANSIRTQIQLQPTN